MDRSLVILVDEQDNPVGFSEKMEAHLKGMLHRAFSIFVFNDKGELLLHQRAMDKYHSGGLWTNTCCSHPVPDMPLETFARVRLKEEMGFEVPLRKIFDFLYRAEMDNGLIEHEFDHVLAGQYDGPVNPDPAEVMDHKFMSMTEIEASMETSPHLYTAWFRMIFSRVNKWQKQSGQLEV